MADILPISNEFKAHLEERYQNINREYYGQDFESWDGHDQEELMPGTPLFDAKVVHYNAPSGKINKCGSCMYSHGTIPIGFIDDSIYKWTANKFASFGSICVVCPEKQNWTVEYIEPFRRENYPIALTNESDFSKEQYISGVCCVNSNIRYDSYCSRILGFNHVTDFDYNDICMLLHVAAFDDEAITTFKASGKLNIGISTDFENYWEGWYDEAAGIKNFQKYPNILSFSADSYARFTLEYDLENPNYNPENWRNIRAVGIQTRWHARNLGDWKNYMTFNTNYEPTFDSDELVLEASLNRNGIGIAGGGVSSFTIRNNCKLDTTPEGTFTQRTSYNPNSSQKNLAASGVLKPFDVSIQTATFRDTFYFYCLSYMRCESFTKEKMLREAAYLGFWFTGNKDSAKGSVLGEDCTDPHIYCPIFDEDFVTTGRYINVKDLDSTPPPVIPVKRGEYITIYDSRTPQDKFDTHGLGVLNPTKCEISETLNGSYTLSIEHPIDPYNKWRYIKVHNIIKALGQLFIIRVVEEQWSGSKGSVTANAEHIFYGLNDYLLPHGRSFSASGARNWAKDYINVALTVAKEAYFDGATNYEYSYGINDRTPVTSEFRDKWNITPEPLNISQLIIGENMLLADTNTQLYRDNFYFSLYERKENTKDNAFEIRIGLNLTGIKRTVDSSTLVTHITGYTDNGESFAISWDEAGTLGLAPHTIKKEMKFNASSWNDFVRQVYDFWGKNCFLLTSYEIDLEEVSTNSDFEEFTEKADYTVGNKGIVYDKRLGERLELQITGTVTDAIRNKVKKVSFGGTRSFIGNNLYQPVVQDTPTAEVNAFQQVRDLEGNFCFDSGGNRIIQNVIGV